MKPSNRLTHTIILAIVLLASLLCLTACQESTSSKYERANKLLTEGKYTEAAAIFDEISTYEDASKMSLYTKAINAAETGDYKTAFSTFTSLGEFKDCPLMLTYYKGRQNEASVYDGAWIYGDRWFNAIEIYESIPLFRDSKDRAENCRKAAYDQAVKSGNEGDISFAISILKKLGTYSDATRQVTYYQAVALLNQGDYSGASETFSTIAGFRDADSRVTSALEDGYKAAAAKEEAGELDEANAIFMNLGEYKDSTDRAYKLYYDAGITRREAKNWNGARSAFTKAGSYSDAPEQIKETTYQEASALEASGDQEGAYKLFISLEEYKDSFERANKPYYDLGIAKRETEDWDEAIAAFEHAEGYSDASIRIEETKYLYAKALMGNGDYYGAAVILFDLRGYKDVDSLIENDKNLAAAAANAAHDAKLKLYKTVGEYVSFGTYPQTSEGTDQTPIRWLVLDYDESNNKALLLSQYGLDTKPYHTENANVTWQTCSLRAWLNKEFLNKAFSAQEQAAIMTTTVDNSLEQEYSKWSNRGGNTTQDKVFLLSYKEANRYLGVTYENKNNIESRVGRAIDAIEQREVSTSDNQTADGLKAQWWLLRSSCTYNSKLKQYLALIVSKDGSLGRLYVGSDVAVRPAFWLNLESEIFQLEGEQLE